MAGQDVMSNTNNRYYLVIEGEDGQIKSHIPYMTTNCLTVLNIFRTIAPSVETPHINNLQNALESGCLDYDCFSRENIEHLLETIKSINLQIDISYLRTDWGDSLKEHLKFYDWI